MERHHREKKENIGVGGDERIIKLWWMFVRFVYESGSDFYIFLSPLNKYIYLWK